MRGIDGVDFWRQFGETLMSWYMAFMGHQDSCDEVLQQYLAKSRNGDPQADLGWVNLLDPETIEKKRAPVERVAIFAEAFWPKVDGVTRAAYLTICHLKQTGREVVVFAPDIAPESVCDSEVVRLRSACIGEVPKTRVVLSTPHNRRLIVNKLNEFRPDMIHLFSPSMFCSAGILYARKHGIPVVANYQTDLPKYAPFYLLSLLAGEGVAYVPGIVRRLLFTVTNKTISALLYRWLRYLHNRSDITLAPTRSVLEDLRQHDYKRLFIWRRGVDGEKFHPRYHSAKWREFLLHGRDANSLVCLYVGRIDREKHIDLLLKVAHLPGVALTIVGDGAAQEEMMSLFEGTRTFFAGRLSGEDLSAAYASADVFVFPSPTETFGQVVQEAMASGLPALVINAGGVADLVEEGKTGYLCPDDSTAFAVAVQKLRDDRALLQQMARNARTEAEKHPWEEIMKQLEGYYATAVQLKQTKRRFFSAN